MQFLSKNVPKVAGIQVMFYSFYLYLDAITSLDHSIINRPLVLV